MPRVFVVLAICVACALAQNCNTWTKIPTATNPPSNGIGQWRYLPPDNAYYRVQRIALVNKGLSVTSTAGVTVELVAPDSTNSYPCTCDVQGFDDFTCNSAYTTPGYDGDFSFGSHHNFDPVPPFTFGSRVAYNGSFGIGKGIPDTGFLILATGSAPTNRIYNLYVGCDGNVATPRGCGGGCNLGGNPNGGSWDMWVLSQACCGEAPTYFQGDGPSLSCKTHYNLPACNGGYFTTGSGSQVDSSNVLLRVPDVFPFGTDANGIVLSLNISNFTHDCPSALDIQLSIPGVGLATLQTSRSSGTCYAVDGIDYRLDLNSTEFTAAGGNLGSDNVNGDYILYFQDSNYRGSSNVTNPGSFELFSITFFQDPCTPPPVSPTRTPTPSRIPPTPSPTRSNSPSATLVSKSATKTPKLTTTPSNAPFTPSPSPLGPYGLCDPSDTAARIYFTRCDPTLQGAQVANVVNQLAADLSVSASEIVVCGSPGEIVGCGGSEANSGEITNGATYLYIDVQQSPGGDSSTSSGILKVVNNKDRSAVYGDNFVVASGNEVVKANQDAIGDPSANLYKPYASSNDDDTGLIVGLTIGLTCFCLLVILAIVLIIALVAVGPVVLGKKE